MIMDVWMDKMKEILEENNVKVYLMTKYVDDINIATEIILSGYGWVQEEGKWRLRWSKEMEELDKERSEEAATMTKLRMLGDSFIPGLKFTQDLPENHPSGK